jgi:hypothetical protein
VGKEGEVADENKQLALPLALEANMGFRLLILPVDGFTGSEVQQEGRKEYPAHILR